MGAAISGLHRADRKRHMMVHTHDGPKGELPIIDLDSPAGAAAESVAIPQRRHQRRQCPHCFTNRSVIFHGELNGCEDRALQALRRAHPEEYDDYLRYEQDTAEAAAAKLWEFHLADQCDRARTPKRRAGRS